MTLKKIIMITETTTLWVDTQNANIVRVLYISNTGWEKTMMADIDLHNGKVNLIMGKDIESREPMPSAAENHMCVKCMK